MTDSSNLPKFSFRILEENDYSSVRDIVIDEFNTREPSSIVLQLSAEECEIAWGPIIQMSLKEQVSLGAFCRVSGALAGCIISQLGKNAASGAVNAQNDESVPLKSKQILEIESPLIIPGLSEILGTDHYMYTSILVCRLQHSCNGLGTELFSRSVEIARNSGCKKYATLAFSYYVQKITDKLGFKTEKEINYMDYIDPYTQEKIFAAVPAPHVKFTRAVKTL